MDNSQPITTDATPKPVYAAAPPTPPTKSVKGGIATASLVLGILALVGAFIPFVNYVSGLLAIVGAVLGLVAVIQKNRRRGTALAGLIISIIATVLSVVLAITYTAGFASSVAQSVASSNDVTAAEPADGAKADAAETDAKPADATGTRDNPAANGTLIAITAGGVPTWEITTGAPVLNANEALMAENQFNEAPPAGMQWAMLPLNMKYVGPETGNPAFDLTVEFVSAAGTTHKSYDYTAVTPNDLISVNEMYPDATASANVSIMIPTADAEKGTWTISTFLSDPYFLAAQ
jgi:hypothetical protein